MEKNETPPSLDQQGLIVQSSASFPLFSLTHSSWDPWRAVIIQFSESFEIIFTELIIIIAFFHDKSIRTKYEKLYWKSSTSFVRWTIKHKYASWRSSCAVATFVSFSIQTDWVVLWSTDVRKTRNMKKGKFTPKDQVRNMKYVRFDFPEITKVDKLD